VTQPALALEPLDADRAERFARVTARLITLGPLLWATPEIAQAWERALRARLQEEASEMMEQDFVEFPKMARLTRECVITEKIDGTNAQVYLIHKRDAGWAERVALPFVAENADFWMLAGSRNRYITPDADNFGFAAWVKKYADDLWALGGGRHYGEWWGSGIQRGYGLTNGEKRFSLFNTSRWVSPVSSAPLEDKQEYAPACCHVVPILYRGLFGPKHDENYIEKLRHEGSLAAPGFMKPEGIVIYHVAAGVMFKKTLEKDDQPKSQHAA